MDTSKCVSSLTSLGVLALMLPGVTAMSDLVPVIAAGAVASFLLLILIILIVCSASAKSWIKSIKKSNGKVKMPRSYFEKKKEAKRRLLAESMRSSRLTQETSVSHHTAPISVRKPAPLVNGFMPPAVPVADKETMVQGWNQGTRKIYEEKGYTMELGDEHDDEFHIETTIVDNEVLDVGPYTSLGETSAKPVNGNVYANPYIYSNNDRVTVIRSSDATGGVVSANSNEMHEIPRNSTRGQTANGDFNIEDHLISL